MQSFQRPVSQYDPGVIQDTGVNGLPRIVLAHPSGARVELYTHGAHITSWKTARGDELLFLSRKSRFKPDCPIRGGIPLVFPQFGNTGPLPQHGLARTGEWALVDSGMTPAGEVFVTLRLEADAGTLRLWPFRFALEYSVRLTDALAVRLTVTNTSGVPFQFQAALHTYFQIADISRTAVIGLKDTELIDSLRADIQEREKRERITFDYETDRIYVKAPDSLQVSDGGNRRSVHIEKHGMNDAVVWNPWSGKSQRMEDFGDDEYLRMVCVETGNIVAPVELNPGARWAGATMFSVAED